MSRRIHIGKTGAFAATIVGVVVALLAINATDEDLAPKTQRMLEAPANTHAPDENLYLALAGFTCVIGVSTIAAGQSRIAEMDRVAVLPVAYRDRAQAILEKGNPDSLRFTGVLSHCHPVRTSCWEGVESHRAAIEALLLANAELYRRYLQLHTFPAYFETAKPSARTQIISVHPTVRRLFLSNVALRVKDATTAEERRAALSELDRDIRMWRVMLKGEGSLDSKLIALDRLHDAYALLADIAGSIGALSEHYEEIGRMLSRLSTDDWKIGAGVGHELRSTSARLHDFQRDSTSTPLFKINATLNLVTRHLLHVRRLVDANGRDYVGQVASLRAWSAKHLATGIGSAYNPIGKALAGVAPEAYEAYALRTHDIAGFHRLVRLGFEIRKQAVGSESVPAFIRQNVQWASHPVNGAPFTWDAARRELAMEPLADVHRERRFRIPVK